MGLTSKTSLRRRMLSQAATLIAALLLSSATSDADRERDVLEIDGVEPFEWHKPMESGSDTLLRFTRAITGKPTKPETDRLMTGVTEVIFAEEGLIFQRQDSKRLMIPKASVDGQKLCAEWEQAQANAFEQFGPSGREFLQSILMIKEGEDGRVEIVRSGPEELCVDLGRRKLHRAFDLRGIRFRHIVLEMGTIADHPALTNIDGVTILLNAPGFTLPVDVKQFCKWKNVDECMDVTVGVKNPLPIPFRALLFMPKIMSFHFILPRKEA